MNQARLLSLSSSLLAAALLLSGCGSGTNSDGGSSGTGAVYPTLTTQMGDWFTYSQTNTPTVGAGTVTVTMRTRTDASVSGDGSRTRVDTFGAGSKSTLSANSAGSFTSFAAGTTTCTYTGDTHTTPLAGARVGSTYAINYVENCATTGSATSSVWTYAGTGTFVGIESRTVPAGTFTTAKYVADYTTILSGSTFVRRWIDTCWVDTQSGRSVECTFLVSDTPTGQSTPSSAQTQSRVLQAYAYRGGAAVGAAIQRFAGNWVVSWGSGGTCNITASVAGALSGSCGDVGLSNAATVQPTSRGVTLSGTVRDDGQFTLAGAGGLILSGRMSTPFSATTVPWFSTSYAWMPFDTTGQTSGTFSFAHQ
jgi:hypothetical protein